MDAGDVLFVLASAALALLSVCGYVLVHAGIPSDRRPEPLVRRALLALAVVPVSWLLVGQAIAFPSSEAFVGLPGLLGVDPALLGLAGAARGGAMTVAMIAFAAVTAVLPVVLLAAVVPPAVGQPRWSVFAALWLLLAYAPVLGWVFDMRWGADGLIGGGLLVYGIRGVIGTGVLDFAGGSTVHVAAGAAALAIALVLRRGRGPVAAVPASAPLSAAGAGLVWIGSIGALAGWEGAADAEAAQAALNALVVPVASLLAWILVEVLRGSRPSTPGAALGVLAGVAAITAGCAYLEPGWAIALGLAAGALCASLAGAGRRGQVGAVRTVLSVHLGGGTLGVLYLGFFAEGDGLAFSGRVDRLLAQAVGALAVFAAVFVVTALLALVVLRTSRGSARSQGVEVGPGSADYGAGMDDEDFERNRRDQLTSAPGDKWDDDEAARSVAPRVEVTETEEGATRIDVADSAAVRPGDPSSQG